MTRIVEQFRPTRWSLVQRAAERDPEVSQSAWTDLCTQYQSAIQTTAHRLARRYSLDAAWTDDVVQDVLTKLPRIARGAANKRMRIGAESFDFSSAANTQSNGSFSFRAYISLSISNALKDALRSRGRQASFSVEFNETSEVEPDCHVDEVEWARCVVHQALESMRASCEASDMATQWGVFEARVVGPIMFGRPAVSYDQIIQQYDLDNTVKAHSALQTAKRKYVSHLREIVGRTCENDAQIDQEIQHLSTVLSSPRARSTADQRMVSGSQP